MGDAFLPIQWITEPSISIEKASNTLGEAVSLAQQLPGQPGGLLFREARATFARSLNFTAVVAAGLMLVVIVAVSWVYRRK